MKEEYIVVDFDGRGRAWSNVNTRQGSAGCCHPEAGKVPRGTWS